MAAAERHYSPAPGKRSQLATHPDRLATVKRKLVDNRLTSPLFDTKMFTRYIESAIGQCTNDHIRVL